MVPSAQGTTYQASPAPKLLHFGFSSQISVLWCSEFMPSWWRASLHLQLFTFYRWLHACKAATMNQSLRACSRPHARCTILSMDNNIYIPVLVSYSFFWCVYIYSIIKKKYVNAFYYTRCQCVMVNELMRDHINLTPHWSLAEAELGIKHRRTIGNSKKKHAQITLILEKIARFIVFILNK